MNQDPAAQGDLESLYVDALRVMHKAVKLAPGASVESVMKLEGLRGAWTRMLHRCYKGCYRSKGRTVCEEWHDFRRFYRDMKEGYQPGLSLDRIDNSKGYCKENCQWLTRSDNSSKGTRHAPTRVRVEQELDSWMI